MIVCVPVDDAGRVGPHWGRAAKVAVAKVTGGAITSWAEYPVGWDITHDAGSHGSHHARIVTFLREHAVEQVVAGGMGPGMVQVTARMGLRVTLGADGDARAAVLAAVAGA